VHILGIWDGHDAGAALLVDGRLAAAVNEERLTRRKLEIDFPRRSIAACLHIAGVTPESIAVVACTTDDVAKAIGRLYPPSKEAYYQVRRRQAPRGLLTSLRTRAKYRLTELAPNAVSRAASQWALRRTLAAAGFGHATLEMYDHHACHAATAAYGSGFPSALVVTIDGLGDGKAATVSRFHDNRIDLVASTPSQQSPGVFFEHVTRLLNMRELEDEGKVMAIADYASPIPDERNPMLSILSARGMSFATTRPGRALHRPLADVLWRYPNEQFAYMAQRALERACEGVVSAALTHTGERRVALAGGVASNIKVNRRLRLLEGVDDVFVFPHMGDGGLALGAALLASAKSDVTPRVQLDDLAFGPAYTDQQIESDLKAGGLTYRRCPDIASTVGCLLADEKIVLWFQGPMEYGPRALGHRSVLARPDRPALRDRLNLVLKRRVWYQPFCPSLLDRDARAALSDFTGSPNRHMTMAYQVAPQYREALSGVTSVDGSCRPQMVADEAPGPFAAMLRELRRRIGIGAVLNTSFNLHGRPSVCTPQDAIEMWGAGGADALAIGPFLVTLSGLGVSSGLRD
jgi:carbamoyltransferase